MNEMTVDTYSPSDVKLSFGGYTIVGWEEISIERRSPSFIPVAGIRGKHTRVATQDTAATISISLLQTSPSNDILSEVHRQDIINGTGRLTLTLKDYSGRSVFSSDEAYILGYPAAGYSSGFEYRVWSVFCQTTSNYKVGGNTRPETSLVDSIINGVRGISGNIF